MQPLWAVIGDFKELRKDLHVFSYKVKVLGNGNWFLCKTKTCNLFSMLYRNQHLYLLFTQYWNLYLFLYQIACSVRGEVYIKCETGSPDIW